MYHAHVQHPMGSGYMMQTGKFRNVEDALAAYLELVDRDSNPFGRLALERNPQPIRVLLIPGHLRGPDAMATTGFCSVWNEDGSDAYEVEQPDYVSVPNPRYQELTAT
ncbi:hypothetical protein LCGC14_2747040 [marine sediment metagenome]|uniref:Uncharacterized protein n=1 Tax=marine sediment metagenome TaxID=412755 RepID=A0A0F8ZPV7_9ZZZZ